MRTYSRRLISLPIVIAFLCAAVAQGATTYYVATTGNDASPGTSAQPFRTIGKGVATAVDGDSVQVTAGTYAERVAWSVKSLLLQGAGAGQSIIDGGAAGGCLVLTGVPSTGQVAGFTLRNGLASPGIGGGLTSNGNGSPKVADCVFQNNAGNGASGLGTFISDSGNPTLVRCTFANNTVSAITTSGGNLTVSGCTFTDNSGSRGGAMFLQNGNCSATRCLFLRNSASSFNSHVFLGNAVLRLTDSLIVATGMPGGSTNIAMEVQPGGAYLTNCTITGTSALVRCQLGSYLEMTNSIVWGPNSGVALLGGSTASIYNSDFPGGSGLGNIAVDPQFVNAAAGNYRLLATSPCINTGSALAPELSATDLDGAPRTMGTAPDMGAYELWNSTSGAWFVDKALGNDTTGAGSPTSPYKTVVKAIGIASAGNRIFIKQGNYGTDKPRITKSLKFYNWLGTGRASIGKL